MPAHFTYHLDPSDPTQIEYTSAATRHAPGPPAVLLGSASSRACPDELCYWHDASPPPNFAALFLATYGGSDHPTTTFTPLSSGPTPVPPSPVPRSRPHHHNLYAFEPDPLRLTCTHSVVPGDDDTPATHFPPGTIIIGHARNPYIDETCWWCPIPHGVPANFAELFTVAYPDDEYLGPGPFPTPTPAPNIAPTPPSSLPPAPPVPRALTRRAHLLSRYLSRCTPAPDPLPLWASVLDATASTFQPFVDYFHATPPTLRSHALLSAHLNRLINHLRTQQDTAAATSTALDQHPSSRDHFLACLALLRDPALTLTFPTGPSRALPTLALTTPPITLTDDNGSNKLLVGPLTLTLTLNTPLTLSSLRIRAVSPNYSSTHRNRSTTGYFHPHIDTSGDLCWGDHSTAAAESLSRLDLRTFFDIATAIVSTYNDSSAYVRLHKWTLPADADEEDDDTSTCDSCGDRRSNDDTYYINDHTYCTECAAPCARCGDAQHRDDLHRVLTRLFCTECVETCGDCLSYVGPLRIRAGHYETALTACDDDNYRCSDCLPAYLESQAADAAATAEAETATEAIAEADRLAAERDADPSPSPTELPSPPPSSGDTPIPLASLPPAIRAALESAP